MGRNKEFDAENVLTSAGALFWRRGYEVVSVQELEEATGLGRGSLYNAFGDKEGLFLAALDRYITCYGEVPFRELATRNVGLGLRRMLDAIIARMSDPANPRGCLLTNSSLVSGTGSRRIDAHVAGKIQAMEMLLERAIARAREEGQIPANAAPKQLARFYGAVVQSLGVMHRACGDIDVLRDIAATAMRAWPGNGSTTKRIPAQKRARPH